MKNKEQIAMQELTLNIKHQLGEVKEFTQVGYEFEEGYFVFNLLIPNKLLGLGKLKGDKE